MPKHSREQPTNQLAQKDLRIAELEHQVEVLRVSHLAVIRTVGELGGMGKLLNGGTASREMKPFELAHRPSASDWPMSVRLHVG
jgi:hypothetical protein